MAISLVSAPSSFGMFFKLVCLWSPSTTPVLLMMICLPEQNEGGLASLMTDQYPIKHTFGQNGLILALPHPLYKSNLAISIADPLVTCLGLATSQ